MPAPENSLFLVHGSDEGVTADKRLRNAEIHVSALVKRGVNKASLLHLGRIAHSLPKDGRGLYGAHRLLRIALHGGNLVRAGGRYDVAVCRTLVTEAHGVGDIEVHHEVLDLRRDVSKLLAAFLEGDFLLFRVNLYGLPVLEEL